ncbi:MAG TPA: ornithine acetyltransferase, partial [Lachnospiraceae bacterium]|nr:ornithine acetyltransferase [Lachnospiraceae bacterium]
MEFQIGDSGVTAPKGFLAAGGSAGIKKGNTRDLAIICSKVPCVAAGTFTTNLVKAAPVKWDQHIVYECPKAQAVIINSGIANACTGEKGLENCRKTAKAASEVLHVPEDAVLVASTGVIGQQLPVDKIEAGVAKLAPFLSGTREAAATAAKAIMTTDTKPKEVSVSFPVGGTTVTIGGMCKGSGMIHP